MSRYAAHRITTPSGQVEEMAVVELKDGLVVSLAPLTAELEFTVWLPGEIELRTDTTGRLTAYYHGRRLGTEP